MIRAYTTNPENSSAIQSAAASRDYAVQVSGALDASDLQQNLDDISVLIFDLTGAAFSAERVASVLDSLDSEKLPPVLYLLASPADIEFIAHGGSIINQDYSFVPLVPDNLAARLDVLTLLGARRRRTLESAITDRLTGLYNRKYFLRRLEEELYRSARYSYAVGLVLGEVDFKAEQGNVGEETATQVISVIGEFLRDRLRRTDISARFKWSEFAILLPDIAMEDSLAVAQDLKRKVESLNVESGGAKLLLSLSVGHVSFPAEGLNTAIDVVQTLEDCCFKAKSTGEVVTFTGAAGA
jgi:diguanylate cyclase (GGDEF)-like protein